MGTSGPDVLVGTAANGVACGEGRDDLVRAGEGFDLVYGELVAVPLGVVTEMGPVEAPAGAVAVICVEELMVKVADTLLNLTAVAPVKFVPVILTDVPTAPEVGVKEVMKGLHLHLGQEAWGHLVARLLRELPVPVPDGLVDRGMVLDTFYVPSRHPNSHPEGAPFEHYGPLQSEEGIGHAGEILAFVRSQMA